LKPVVVLHLTEVREGSTASAHLFRRRGCMRMLLPCENDQAKLDHISRLACSTNLSKILEGDPPERTLLDRGPGCDARVSSNLLRRLDFCVLPHPPPFLREPSKPIELRRSCQGLFFKPTQPRNYQRSEATHCAKYQIATGKICPSR
jgi:hypothetical protein